MGILGVSASDARPLLAVVQRFNWLFRNWSAGEGVTDRGAGVVSLR